MLRRSILTAMAFAACALTEASSSSAASTTVVISEFRTRGPNGGNDEFIELFNKTNGAINIGGYKIRRSSGATTSDVVTIPAGTIIQPRRFYLIVNTNAQGYSGTVAGDLAFGDNISIADDGGIALLNGSGTIVDAVGMSAATTYVEGQPLVPMSLNVNQSFERKVASCSPDQDTDDNLADFNVNGSLSRPQSSTSMCNPCQNVICNAPPNSGQCYNPTGVCQSGTCNYSQRPAGAACSDSNACTVGDSCNASAACIPGPANPCNTPPQDFCSDANTLVTYQMVGTCDPSTGCSYSSSPMACAFGCNGTTRACNPNPCTGVSCNSPPNECYAAAGTCSGGTCSYAFQPSGTGCSDDNGCTVGDTCDGAGVCVSGTLKTIDDDNPCTEDACNPATGTVTNDPLDDGTACDDGNFCNGISTCQSGTCTAGSPVVCNTPPAGGCYSSTGTCNPTNGACSYAPLDADTPCNDENLCTTDDACDGNGACGGSTVACSPPPPECQGTDSSRSYTGGVCESSTGTCSFTNVDTSCANGCNQDTGRCNEDPCAGVACDEPPSQCHTGTCSNGECSYVLKAEGVDCEDGDSCTASDQCSSSGVCAGTPLACNTQPAALCLDSTTSRIFNAAGTCEDGTCTYAPIDTECDTACDEETGLCEGDPCLGKNCDDPPSQCHLPFGTCLAGECSYEPAAVNSACNDDDVCTTGDVCSEEGVCGGLPKICNTPLPPECIGDTSRVYDAAGMCDEFGDCAYTPTDTECEEGCNTDNGLCVGDECAGIVCETPPGQCFFTTGTCTDGECSYGPEPEGTPCDDGDECTQADACDGDGECTGALSTECVDGGAPPVDGGLPDGSPGLDGSAGSRPDDGSMGEPDAGPSEGGSSGVGGSGGRAGAGSGGRSGASPTEDAGADAQGDPNLSRVEGGGGCGCAVPKRSSGSGALAGAMLFGLAVILRRRRRHGSNVE